MHTAHSLVSTYLPLKIRKPRASDVAQTLDIRVHSLYNMVNYARTLSWVLETTLMLSLSTSSTTSGPTSLPFLFANFIRLCAQDNIS